MKKNIFVKVLMIVMFVVTLFSFTACDLFKNMEIEIESTANTKEGCVELLDDFFGGTLEHRDFIVTEKNSDGSIQSKESVLGDNCYIWTEEIEYFVYIKDGFYYFVGKGDIDFDGNIQHYLQYETSDESKPYYSEYAKDYHDGWYCSFYSNFKLVKNLPEDGGTFACSYLVKGTEENLEGTFDFTFTSNGGTITISGTSLNDLVQTARVTVTNNNEPEANRDLTFEFEYDCAVIEIPDTDEFQRQAEADQLRLENNSKAMDARSEFLGDSVNYTNLVVTVKDSDGKTYLVDTIDDGAECMNFGSYTVYTYALENDEAYDYYFVYDSKDSKFYTVNGEDYDKYVLKFYYSYIALTDSRSDDYEITYTEGENVFTYTVFANGEKFFELLATKSGDRVTSINTSLYNFGTVFNYVLTFEYDVADISTPDLTNYTLRTSDN